MNNRSNVIEVLKTFSVLALGNWQGLSGETSVDDARAVFGIDDQWHGTGKLGSDGNRRDWFSASAAHFPEGLRLWVDGDRLLLIDAVRPDLPGGFDALFEKIGQPSEELDSYLGTLPIRKSEWVYPERGLTLFVNPANRLLLRIAVYRPTSIEDYRKTLRLDLQRIRLPLGEMRVSGGHR